MNVKYLMVVTGALSALALAACSPPGTTVGGVTSASSSSVNSGSLVGKVALSVIDPSNGNLVYSDKNPGSSLKLLAGKQYNVNLAVSQSPAGTSASLACKLTSVVSGPTSTFSLQPGNNAFAVPAMGDYACSLVTNAPGFQSVTQNYIADVTCSSPTFTAASLNAAGISVSAGSVQNIYNYSSAAVVSGANGVPPYSCAWDITGSGIQDSGFHDCSTALSGAYVNYVGTRNVGLLVKDSCNTTYSVSKAVNLAYAEPAKPGNVFIFGQVSGATGSLASDVRVNGVNYLATNANGNNIVQPNYAGGTFQITAMQNYGLPSSAKFGVQINVNGITDNINVKTGTGSISAASASMTSLIYSTDQAGDQSPQVTLKSSSCVLSAQGARVSFIQGQPCTAGTTGDNNAATVEVWGHYVCSNLANASGSASIAGDFDGSYKMVDNCSGGGGGGGGVTPISL